MLAIEGQYPRLRQLGGIGPGKNWTVSLSPDPLRPGPTYSVANTCSLPSTPSSSRRPSTTPGTEIPLATFPRAAATASEAQGIRDVVDGRAVYLMPVGSGEVSSARLRGIRRPPRGTTRP